MSAVTATGERSRTGDLGRLPPLVLLAVAMPWILEWAIVEGIAVLAPASEPLARELADGILYPVVTGSVVLAGLYASIGREARRSLFAFRRPSGRELLVVAGAVLVGYLGAGFAQFAVVSVSGTEPATGPGMDGGLRSILIFVVVGGVFAPLVEEVLFRGLLLGYLLERGVPTVLASGIVVAAFGAIHSYAGPAGIATGLVLGVVLVWLRLRYDDLVAPILAHSASNMLSLVLILVLY